jgi:hypothetical protein
MKRLITAVLACACAMASAQAADTDKPKVRAITAFVRLERSTYEAQIEGAMKVLNAAKAEFTRRGYEIPDRPHRDPAFRGAGEGPVR